MDKKCSHCFHYQICRDWYGHEDGMPNYAFDIDCKHYIECKDITSEYINKYITKVTFD